MTVLRCTPRLLKRLHKPAKPPEPEPQSNPLGEWYGDFDFLQKHPFVVFLNPATGAVMLLPARFHQMNRLHEFLLTAFAALCMQYELTGPGLNAELRGFNAGFACATAHDRDVLDALDRSKEACFMQIALGLNSMDVAASEWHGVFNPPELGRDESHWLDHPKPIDLLRRHLGPVADVLPFRPRSP
jgi:hypothetical protein